jgi:hypothetical protein
MRHVALPFFALILLSPTLRAIRVEGFAAREKGLRANREKLSEADRPHRFFEGIARRNETVLEAQPKETVAKRRSA